MIGVILMVAITVILAAVIGGFVLGLGDSLESAPSSQISVDPAAASAGNSGDGIVAISHNGGDPLPDGDYQIQVQKNGTGTYKTVLEGGTASQVDVDGDTVQIVDNVNPGEFKVGNEITIEVMGGDARAGTYSIQIIHTPSDSIIAEGEAEV
ncbi:type IV pilin N-terminal domain-containing protein [Halolamina pelagica]